MNIAVFLGSSAGVRSRYQQDAEEFGAWLAAGGHTLIFGGEKGGLMGSLAGSCISAGGRVIGVIPEFMYGRNHVQEGLADLLITDGLPSRKTKMLECADCCVAFPGGIGTFDEIGDALSGKKLGICTCSCIVYTPDGYYESLRMQFDRMVEEGFLDKEERGSFRFASSMDELKRMLSETEAATGRSPADSDGAALAASSGKDADGAQTVPGPPDRGARMKLMISACLLGVNCKYDGGNNQNEAVLALAEKNEVIPICPEQMGGLPTPRVPSEIREGSVFSEKGISVDKEFRRGAALALEMAQREKPDLIILKAKSPSCGAKNVYDGTFSGKLVSGRGVTADALIRAGFRVIEETDLLPCSGLDKTGILSSAGVEKESENLYNNSRSNKQKNG